MADVEDGHAARSKLRDEAEEALDVAALQGAGRLVHEDEAGVAGQRAADLDDLSIREREIAGRLSGIDLASAELCQERRRTADEPLPSHPRRRAFRAEEDVLRHGEVRADGKLLVDVRDPPVSRVGGAFRRVRLAGQSHAAGVRFDEAGEDVQQGALARAVLANEGMHLARVDGEIDSRERGGGAESLLDAVQGDEAHFR